jgi:hypothetical protein
MALWHNPIDNSIHDDMNGEALALPVWPQGMVQITQAEAEALLAPPPLTSVQKRAAIDAQISTLEEQQLLPRITRETLLAIAVSTAAAQGITEPQLYASNIGYRRLKDFDTAIAVLRAQMPAIV